MINRLIIVDDEEYIQKPLKNYFEDCRWIVNTFSTAEEALDFLKTEKVQAVITDLHLRWMSGPEFIIEADKIRPDMRYVIYTGSLDFSISGDLLALKNVIIVRKPSSLRELLEAVQIVS